MLCILKFWFKPPAIDIFNWKTFHIFSVHMYSNILINQNFNPTSLTITQVYILLWWRFRLDTWIDTRLEVNIARKVLPHPQGIKGKGA
jgi:hypothetical protein